MAIKPNNFVINAADLTYILKQIKIAEATSVAYTAAPKTILQAIMDAYGVTAANAAQLPAGLRTVDGSFNNLWIAPSGTPGTPGYNPGTSEYGAADNLFPRLTDPVYMNEADEGSFNGITSTNYGQTGNVVDSDPRTISNLIVDMSVNNPAAIAAFFTNPLALDAFAAAHPGMTPVAPSHPDAGTGVYLAITNEDLQTMPNQSPDIGLTAGFNSWMTYFGQFFDHGLDLVTKGNAGTVYIPLKFDDPLYNAGPDGIAGNADDARTNFMALTRATQTLDANGVPQHQNTTTSFIDQNQTYTSHASHQVFLREYKKIDIAGDGLGLVAVSTGKLLDGTAATGSVAGAIGNWTDVKAQALTMLGIKLDDFDIHNAPLLVTDQYGKFIPGANGYAQMVMAATNPDGSQVVVEGTAAGITTAGSLGSGHAFLDDIAHHAAPAMVDHDNDDRDSNGIKDGPGGLPATPKIRQVADDDYGVGLDGFQNADKNKDGIVSAAELVADDGNRLTYDDEMLNAHFITGDGRGNENIALTAVHSIFHSEHNRTVEDNKGTILATAAGGDLAFLNEWLLVDVTAVPADLSTLVWDGERLFQAARFTTEMQYQHLVFEEFARRIQPMVDPFIFNNSPEIDASILAEFAHTVYRFGHSMLTGTVDRLNNNLETVDGADQASLLAVFLNPQSYVGSGATLEEINANLVRGLSRDVGNAMDEFIVTDVRSNLLGLPLDLGALNIARGRDTGIPSLNETRRQLYDDTGLADLRPYDSWADFAANIKNAASIVNFIAAYGTHSTITSATTMADKRAAAEAIVFGGIGAPADRLDFINATGAYAGGSLGGLNTVDLWIGGLAEANPEFGGMLGTTFNYVFEAQMEMLQNGDRLYYLSRTQGQNILNQLEPNTFSDLVMRNTDLGDLYATHISGALFVTPDLFLELDRGIAQEDYNGSDAGRDPHFADDEPHSAFDQKVTRTSSGTIVVDGVVHDVGGTLRFIGGEHVVIGGTEGDDRLYGDKGDDSLWGDGGNDYLNGGTAADDVFGGDGDDIIEDPFGDDVLRGQAGNDVITSARGFDLMFGGEGSDVIIMGQDMSEVFAGEGDDFVLGGAGSDAMFGNEGDDWMEGGAGFDGMAGDNSELFFNSEIIGHDVMFAQADETDYDAESGDDIMGSGASVFRYEGMYGFDWAIAKGDNAGVDFDMQIKIFTAVPNDILRDRFDSVEALSGYTFNDVLEGDDRGSRALGETPGITADSLFLNDILNQAGIDRIDGFSDWFGGARQTLFGGATPLVGGTESVTSYRDGNILIGGDGNDTIQGNGGFDLIDGDAYLNVRIGINVNGVHYSAESLNTDKTVAGQYAGRVYAMKVVNGVVTSEVDFAAGPAFAGRSLTSLLLDRTINPGQMSIVREIKYDATNVTGSSMNIDTAVYHGALAEYDIEGRVVNLNGIETSRAHDVDGDGFISIRDRDDGITGATVNGVTLLSRKLLTDDVDLIKNIEELRFSDRTLVIAGPNLIKGPSVDLHGFNLVTTQTAQYLDNFQGLAFNNSAGATPWTTSWVESGDDNAMVTGQIQINEGDSGAMRFILGDGASITRAVSLDPAANTTLSYVFGYTNIDLGESLRVEFAANGNDWVTVQLIAGAADNAITGGNLVSFSVNGTANSAVRFTVTSLGAGETMRIEDVSFVSSSTVPVLVADGTGFAATYTEDAPGVAIASGSLITDPDNTTILSAQVKLTNAQALDVLAISGALPGGITSSIDSSVAGQITLTLSGSASKADYQTAVQAVRYSNTSQNPNTTQRIIEVRATSADGTSPAAIATVTVVSVNDAPVTVADAIVTNISTGNIVVPEWALLRNDSDVDGPLSLDITAVSAAVGITGLSLVTNAGSVTFADDGGPAGSFTYTANDGGVGGTRNGAVTVTNQGYTTVADNFNGVNNATPSAANNSTGSTAWVTSWIEANDNAVGIVANNIRTGQVQIDGGANPGTNDLRFGVGDGASLSRVVNLAGVTTATLSLAFDKNGIDVGEFVDVQFAADGVNFVTLNRITNTNGTNGNGNAAGTLALTLTGALSANSTIRFVGSGINTVGEDIRLDNVVVSYGAASGAVTAAAGNQILVGNDAGSTFSGGAGDDTVFANGGDDIINWAVGHGRDFIDGGGNGAAGDRYVVTGDNTVEAYIVYTAVEATAAGHTGLNAATEIVVTRNGVVIGELDNVEEITINTLGGVDTTAAIGDFTGTSLFFNTITVNGGGGRDRIDASQLTSAHKLVLNGSSLADFGVMGKMDGFGGAVLNQIMRKGLLDFGSMGELGFMSSRQQTLFSVGNGDLFNPLLERLPTMDMFAASQSIGEQHNPMFDRVAALDMFEIASVAQTIDKVLPHYAVDYLII